MKPRQLAFLTAFVAALAAAVAYQTVSHDRATSQSDTRPVLDVNVVAEEINRVVVTQGGADSTRVVVEKLPDRWVVRTAWDHEADERKVRELIDALNGLRGEFRSDDASVLADYGLGPDADPASITVTLYGADWQEVAAVELGAASQGGVFLREPGRDAAYLSRTDVLGKLGMWGGPKAPEQRTFLDLDVFKCDPADIRSITLTEGDEVLRLEKTFAAADSTGAVDPSTWEWVLTQPERRPLAKTKADGLMTALTKVQAADVADPKADWRGYGLWKAPRRVEVGLADGGTFELRWGEERDAGPGTQEGVYVMSSRDQTVWVIRKFKADQIFKTLADLLPES